MIRLRPRHWSIRGRLTVLYGGLFFAAGTILLTLNYLLVWQSLNTRMVPGTDISRVTFGDLRAPGGLPTIRLDDGREIRLDDAIESVRAAQQSLRDDVLDSLLVQGSIALFGVGLVAGLLGWLLARRALQPVHRITETAQRIARTEAKGLHERISLTGPKDEVAELASTFNTMLERLDRSFEGQHRFVTNASHEMRTPLAVKRALIEVSTSRPGTSEDAKRLGDALLEVNARHERLIDGLLTLVDSENELTERSRVDLAEVAGVVLRQLADPAREAGVELRDGRLGPAPALGDPVLLERLVQNLVENAIRHNQPGGWLTVTTEHTGETCTLVVSNSGRVIQPYQTEILFQPFRRLDRERISGERGFGLGLSIVRAISTAHGGEVRATPRPDGGLDLTVRLPVES
jgi:signal transduction histidine kinase